MDQPGALDSGLDSFLLLDYDFCIARMKNTSAIRRTILFLTVGVFLALMVILGIKRFHESRRYLQGDVIRLIDDMNDECILHTPIIMPLRSVRKEPLDQDWTRQGSLDSGITIWRTNTSRFIVSPSSLSPGPSQRVYRQDRVLKHQPDLWSPKTAADCWNSRDNQIFISTKKGENPNRVKYYADYKTFDKTSFVMVEEEKLNNPLTFATFHDGQAVRRLVVFPVSYPMWMQGSEGMPFKTVIRRNQQVLPFRHDLAERLNPPNEKLLVVYPTSSSAANQPYPLFNSADKLCLRLHVVPGHYIIKLIAKASLAGSELPVALVSLSGREVARVPIASEDWQPYFVSVLIERADMELSVEFTNDYYDHQNLLDRNIFIFEVRLWPDQAPDEVRLTAGSDRSLPTAWSWLDDSQEVLFEAQSNTIFNMFNNKDVFLKRWFCQKGLVSFLITALGEMAGDEKPRLTVYLDKKRVGVIQVESNSYQEYTLNDILITTGWHKMEVVYENDFYDWKTHRDRNIYLLRVALKHQSAVIVSEPADKPPGNYTVSYPSRSPLLYQLHLYRRYLTQETGRVNFLAWRVDREGEIRKALVCAPQTRLVYRLKVPSSGKLRFGYSIGFEPMDQSKSPASSRIDELTIKIKEDFHGPRKIFSLKIPDSSDGSASPWRDEVLDLEAFAGKKVEIFMERLSRNQGLGARPDLFVSNPVISGNSRHVESDPNVVIIAPDALRADHLGCYGYERQTSPNIDKFAGESAFFQRAISQASWTRPSFVSLFTSLEPSFHGIFSSKERLISSMKTLPKILQENGYTTAASVDNPHLFPAMGIADGFDFYSYLNTEVEGQLATVENWLDSLKDQKFFLFLHLISTHAPYTAPAPFADTFRKPDHLIAKTSSRSVYDLDRDCERIPSSMREDIIARYDGEILYLDDILLRLLNSMKQLGLYRDTLVILLSDHGEQFQEHGYISHGKSLYQEEILIPLIMKLPAGFPSEAKRIPASVSSIDILPTILDILNIRYTGFLRGKSLVPLLQGQAVEENLIFSELNIFGKLAIMKDQYKYIYTDQEICASALKKMNRLNCWPGADEELYDLKKDPAETRNIAAYRPDLLEMFRKERKHFEEMSLKFRQSFEKKREEDQLVLDKVTTERLRALGYIR